MNAPVIPGSKIVVSGVSGAHSLPMSAEQVRDQVNAVQKIMQGVMREGEHYGKLPGSKKPSLWKPGAEKLCMAFHIEPSYQVEDLSAPDCYRYRVRCVGTHQGTGIKLGEGMGSASSNEEKYRWRRTVCAEEFDNTPESRRRTKYGLKQGGGTYTVKQVRTEPDDGDNTILKMACKRAHVAMILNVTAASDIFTQDIEDLPEHLREVEGEAAPMPDGPQSKSAPPPPPRPEKKAESDQPPAEKKTNGDSTPAPAGQIRIIESKLKAVAAIQGRTEQQVRTSCLAAHGLETFEGITVETGNHVLSWIAKAADAPADANS